MGSHLQRRDTEWCVCIAVQINMAWIKDGQRAVYNYVDIRLVFTHACSTFLTLYSKLFSYFVWLNSSTSLGNIILRCSKCAKNQGVKGSFVPEVCLVCHVRCINRCLPVRGCSTYLVTHWVVMHEGGGVVWVSTISPPTHLRHRNL